MLLDLNKIEQIMALQELQSQELSRRLGYSPNWFTRLKTRILEGADINPDTVGELCRGLFNRKPTREDIAAVSPPRTEKKNGRGKPVAERRP